MNTIQRRQIDLVTSVEHKIQGNNFIEESYQLEWKGTQVAGKTIKYIEINEVRQDTTIKPAPIMRVEGALIIQMKKGYIIHVPFVYHKQAIAINGTCLSAIEKILIREELVEACETCQIDIGGRYMYTEENFNKMFWKLIGLNALVSGLVLTAIIIAGL